MSPEEEKYKNTLMSSIHMARRTNRFRLRWSLNSNRDTGPNLQAAMYMEDYDICKYIFNTLINYF